MKKNSSQGFTLIEVMIAVVIVGILAAIAYPSYIDYIIKSGRSEGVAAVMKVANLQEQYYLDNRAYTTDMSALGLTPTESIDAEIVWLTEHSYYKVGSDTSGTITATVNPDSRQVKDTTCATITMTSAGVKGPSAECWK